jgi:hypothetical protein
MTSRGARIWVAWFVEGVEEEAHTKAKIGPSIVVNVEAYNAVAKRFIRTRVHDLGLGWLS